MKRSLAFALSLLILLSLFTACSATPTNTASTDPAPAEPPTPSAAEPTEPDTPVASTEPIAISYPLTDTPVTFNVIANGQISQSVPEMQNDLNQVLAVQEISRITGVDIDWEMPADTATTVSLMLVSEDYSDGLVGYTSWLGNSLDYCVEEDILLDLTDILQNYCPNYWNTIHEDESILRDAITDNGRLPAMYKITDQRPECYLGYYIRTDVLESAGFSAENLPVTYDDLETILLTGKNSASNAPLYLDQTTLLAGYDLTTGFVHNGDQQLYFGPTSEHYKAYLTMLANWNAQGFIDKDFATRISFFLDPGLMMSGEVIAYPGVFSFRNVFENAGLSVTSIPYPKLQVEDLRYQAGAVNDAQVCGDALMIFSTTEQPELLAQWFDFTFSEEGALIANLGIQGQSYDFDENGSYIYPLDPEANVDLLSFSSMMVFKSLTWREYIGEAEIVTEDRAKWGADWSYEKHNAQGALTAEESEAISSAMTDINTYVSEFSLGVIAGSRSLNDWDEYVAYLNTLGLADCQQAYQAAHNRYLAR